MMGAIGLEWYSNWALTDVVQSERTNEGKHYILRLAQFVHSLHCVGKILNPAITIFPTGGLEIAWITLQETAHNFRNMNANEPS